MTPSNRPLRSLAIFLIALAFGSMLGSLLRPILFASAGHDPLIAETKRNGDANLAMGLPLKRQSSVQKIATQLDQASASTRTLWLAAKAEKAGPAELARLFTLAKREGHRESDLVRAIATRWAQADPSHMCETLTKNDDGDGRVWMVLTEQWAENDPSGALKRILELTQSGDDVHPFWHWRSRVWGELMRSLPEEAIKATRALGLLDRLIDPDDLRTWVEQDPKHAARWVQTHLESSRASESALGVIGGAWGKMDPEAALDFAIGLQTVAERKAFLTGVIESWTATDPDAAAAYAAEQGEEILPALEEQWTRAIKEIESQTCAPKMQSHRERFVDEFKADLEAAKRGIEQSRQRVCEGKKPSAAGKMPLSISDLSASIIMKGGWDRTFGYRPQLGFSSSNLVTALIVPEGNAADQSQYIPLVKATIENTGVTPQVMSTDDGYTGAEQLKACQALGVEVISFSGARGRALLGEETWNSKPYQEARRARSGAESGIGVLKGVERFGELSACGIEKVRGELLEKVLSYNALKIITLRKRKHKEEQDATWSEGMCDGKQDVA